MEVTDHPPGRIAGESMNTGFAPLRVSNYLQVGGRISRPAFHHRPWGDLVYLWTLCCPHGISLPDRCIRSDRIDRSLDLWFGLGCETGKSGLVQFEELVEPITTTFEDWTIRVKPPEQRPARVLTPFAWMDRRRDIDVVLCTQLE